MISVGLPPLTIDTVALRVAGLVFSPQTNQVHVGCFHCASQLRDLVREGRNGLDGDAEIVAVSSRKLSDPEQALEALGVNPNDRFRLAEDPSQRSFRDFGAFDGIALHGLFLIDVAGNVRARYTGPTPYEEIGDVIRRARALSLDKAAFR